MSISLSIYKSKLVKCLILFLLVGLLTPLSFADTKYRRVYDPVTHEYYYVPVKSLKAKTKDTFRNPVVKKAAVGAAVGTAVSLLSDKSSLLKGAGIGALAGAGSGLIDRSQTLADKPLVKTALQGATIGTGASIISDKSVLKGALIGAGAGSGLHYLKKYILNDQNDY